MTPPAESDFQGTDRFEILRRIGAGGMGAVYEAYDRERKAKVALKTLLELDANGLYRFKNEFRALSDIHHRNLVGLGQLITEGGQWFFTMELVEGRDFLAWVRPSATAAGGATAAARTAAAPAAAAGTTLEMPPRREVPVRAEEPPRPPPPLDEARLRSALGQLALGVHALHEAGKVHRDLKPSNVLVTDAGRVVLLDFGLITETAAREAEIIGTPYYMAPEQAAGQPVGPEADWYSAGVMLYEALTGAVPHRGSALRVIAAKQVEVPPAPRALAPGVAEDLDRLCVDLLQADPRARPSGADVLARLGVRAPTPALGVRAIAPPPAAPRAPWFVGRGKELAALAGALGETRAGRAVTVFIEGESGAGKSALVRRFLETLAEGGAGALAFSGRSYERDAVPLKALDGVIDAMSQHLARLGEGLAEALLPRDVTYLAELFPVLGRVPAVAALAVAPAAVRDAESLRRRAVAALRVILSRIAERQPLVLALDDIQTADRESLALLAEVLRPPDAPRLLLLATVRPGPAAATAAIEGDVRRLALGPLRPEAAEGLARSLLASTGGGRESLAAEIARESRGNPHFIQELVRWVAGARPAVAPPLRLEDALRTRISRLEEPARLVLDLIALAGGPLPHVAVAVAADMDGERYSGCVVRLRVANLVRAEGAGAADTIETYHDRIREAALGAIAAEARRSLEERLAKGLAALAPGEKR